MLRKRLFCFAIISILLLIGTICNNTFSKECISSCDNESNSKAKWTVMYYMCGDSNMDIYIDPLLEKLSNIGSNEDLNIVCLVDRQGYGNSKLIYINQTGQQINLSKTYGWPDEIDMGNQNTFESFCMQVMESFPANHYAFMTYANGGTGWTKYPLDDKDGRGFLTIPELAASLKKITSNGAEKIDVIQTSCCMSNIELSYEIAPYVDYLITTQEHIAEKTILPRFYKLLWDLSNNTNMNPEEFAETAAFRHEPHTYQYFESYGEKICCLTKIFNKLPFTGLHTVMMHSSVAIVNLGKIDDLVESVNDLSSYMLLYLQDKKFKDDIKHAREEVREFGKAYPKFWIYFRIYPKFPLEIFSYDCRIDLYNFVDLLRNDVENLIIKNHCLSIMEKINESIIELVKIPDDPTYGFNIYFPMEPAMYNKDIFSEPHPSPYENLKFSKDACWDEFLKEFLGV